MIMTFYNMWIVCICIWYEWYCGLYGVVCPLLASRWPPLPDSTLTNIGSHYRRALLNIPTWAKAIHARTMIPTCLLLQTTKVLQRLNWAAWERSGESAITISSSSSSGISTVVEEEARAHSSSAACQLFFCIVRPCVLASCASSLCILVCLLLASCACHLCFWCLGHALGAQVGCDQEQETACGRLWNNVQVLKGTIQFKRPHNLRDSGTKWKYCTCFALEKKGKSFCRFSWKPHGSAPTSTQMIKMIRFCF